MAKLYELSGVYAEAIDLYNSAETDEQQTLALDILRGIEEPFEEKVENTCKIIREIESEESILQTEIDRLKVHLQSAGRRRDNLKSYLKQCIEGAGLPKPKVETDLFKVWIQNNPPSVQILCDARQLPDKYKITIPVSYQADKKAILEDAKAGVELPEVIVIEQGTHLRIK